METMQIDSNKKQINWHEYNYPPIIRLMHFRPSQLSQDRKNVIIMLFIIHILVLINTILSIIDNCIEGGLGILYSFLWFFIFNPIVLFVFYRAYIGLCKQKSKLSLYIFIQPLIIIIEIVISIIDFLGFNGFIMVNNQFKNGNTVAGIFGLIVSLIYLVIALWSSYIYYRIFRQRSSLTKTLL